MNKQEPEIKDLSKFLNLFNKESDRGAALIAASFLDNSLKEIIEVFLIDNKSSKELIDGFNAPIGTFSSRINLANSLGLLMEDEYLLLHSLRKIRNEFGHEWDDVTFDSKTIQNKIQNLKWYGPEDITERTNKAIFNFAVVKLLANLLWRKRLVQKQRLTKKNWLDYE
ncbi:MAG: transcriptional regulator [Rhodobacteraceae bacterium]|nr:transcriptional regulator [Paracoccaceae bacterium]